MRIDHPSLISSFSSLRLYYRIIVDYKVHQVASGLIACDYQQLVSQIFRKYTSFQTKVKGVHDHH